jgi:hypothetical protein
VVEVPSAWLAERITNEVFELDDRDRGIMLIPATPPVAIAQRDGGNYADRTLVVHLHEYISDVW